jgi:phage tail sheath protein FI
MGQMKTPGVYIVEKSAFPNSVVEVATAVPAFIGYTEKADNRGKSLRNKPWRIASMSDFHNYFGFAPNARFSIEAAPKDDTSEVDFSLRGTAYYLKITAGNYLLYYSMLLFFQNGGGPCYIVSVGGYGDDIEADYLQKGVELLVKEQEPTMVVIPETVLLDEDNSISVQQTTLAHCGGKMKNRFAILDVWGGYRDRKDPSGDCIDNFRSALGINYLDYAAAYYPWINTTIVQDKDLSYENIENLDLLQNLLREELGIPDNVDETTPAKVAQQAKSIDNITSTWDDMSDEESFAQKTLLAKSLAAMSSLYSSILDAIKSHLNLLPPGAAMAGVFTMVDNSRGVWKAPANVSLSAVVSSAVNITHDEQEDLNVNTQGKSINAIRTFIGEGTLVWGARTLDGNSLDWRYINVRRTLIMLEESIRLAAKAYVFDPNDANTWVTIKSMIRNFLTGIWKRGGLVGAVPDDAFSVHVGLGETMTAEDILEGILRVTVLVAVSRPAEFIEITFQQQMQKS